MNNNVNVVFIIKLNIWKVNLAHSPVQQYFLNDQYIVLKESGMQCTHFQNNNK
jgi:hypothetical protein